MLKDKRKTGAFNHVKTVKIIFFFTDLSELSHACNTTTVDNKYANFFFSRLCYSYNLSPDLQENRLDLVRRSKDHLRGSILDTGYSDEEWAEEWNKLEHNGIYEVNFGDFLLYGLYFY